MPDWLTWLGTPFQGLQAAALISLLGYLLLHQRGMAKLAIEAEQVNVNANQVSGQERADIRDHYAQEVDRYFKQVVGLRDEVEKCKKDCDAREEACERKIADINKSNDALRKEVWGEKQQRVAEQISLINVILKTVDAPELKTLMKTLENVQRQQTLRLIE